MAPVIRSTWRSLGRSACCAILLIAYAGSCGEFAFGQADRARGDAFFGYPAGATDSSSGTQIQPTEHDPIIISCEYLHEETPSAVDISARLSTDSAATSPDPAADGSRVFVLRDRCRIRQGKWELSARQMVIWQSQIVRNGRTIEKLLVYPEGEVALAPAGTTPLKTPLLLELYSSVSVTKEAKHFDPDYVVQGGIDPLHRKALNARSEIQQTAYNQPQLLPQEETSPILPPESDFNFESLAPPAVPAAGRHIVISPRSLGIGYNVSSGVSHETSPPEQVTIISQGVNIVIEGLSDANGRPAGTLDLSADQVVIWAQTDAAGKFSPEMYQSKNAPLQLYLEGNIEIRQGNHVLKASKAFYDIRENRAILADGELRMHVPELQGDIKLRAQRIRQLSQDSFHAEKAWVTGSEFGVPTYRLEAGDIFLENRYDDGWLGKGKAKIDSETGLEIAEPTPWVTSLDNRFRIGETPVFMTPFLSGKAVDPHIPLKSLSVGADNIMGVEMKSVWKASKLLGIPVSPGTEWNLQLHGFSERGVWLGTDAEYTSGGAIGQPGTYFGETEAVWINDFGRDNLGLGRRDLDVPHNTRGRILWRHHQQMTPSLSWTGEIGFLSDRNFLEQYYESEWDRGKDNETLLGLNFEEGNIASSVMARTKLNEFEYETQWLPRADFTILGEPLLWDRLLYSSRSSAGYGQLKPARAPDDPNDLFVPLWYMPEAEGAVLSTRHELSLPFTVGAVNFDPYVMGEAAYWQDDGFTNSSLHRLYGSAGLRGNMMLWKAYPHIRSQILGLNGLAHKQTIGFDYSFSDSSEDLSDIPQYNEFDENAQERFRTRLIYNTFGFMNSTQLPPQFDPRQYAVRSGAARNVSSPYFELVDDLQVLRLNWNHRLQTKVGPPERQRVKDWMTLDLGLSYFPDAAEDNFGESFGLLTANYMWDVGARTKFLANGQFDFFEEAPQIWDVGFLSQRSSRGSIYVGYRNFSAGPLESQLLSASASYQMSEKWLATVGTAYDIKENQDRGQSLTLTAIRADYLLHLGFSVDASKGNFGIGFMIEPRLGQLTGSMNKMLSMPQY